MMIETRYIQNCANMHHAQSQLELIFLAQDTKMLYLGVPLKCALAYKYQLTKVIQKIRSEPLLNKLVGSIWGANVPTLYSLGLALCYSVGE